MAEHTVMVQNIEESEFSYSVTGLVDNRQAAVVLNKLRLPKGLSRTKLIELAEKELARAYEVGPAAPSAVSGHKVVV